jgi:aryl-alcohol dehydrogenase-like predicted oxidoreductase
LPRVDALKALVPSGSSLPDLALRFILHHKAVSTTIPGMRSLPHVDANIAASDAPPLGADLIAALRAHRWERTWQVP